MKNVKKIIAVLLLAFAIGCSKEDQQATEQLEPVVVIPKVKTFTIGNNLYTHTYDTQGRLLTQVSSDGYKDEYSYANNKVTYKFFQSNVQQSTYVYDLNTDGFKIKSLRTFPSAGNYQTIYTYNANKQLATLTNSNSLDTKTSTKTFFYEGKNLEHYEETFSYNADIWKFYYTYYTDKTNTFSNKNKGYLFDIEEDSQHPVKTFTAVFSPTNTQVDTYAYEYDSQNQISKRIINGSAQNDIEYY